MYILYIKYFGHTQLMAFFLLLLFLKIKSQIAVEMLITASLYS